MSLIVLILLLFSSVRGFPAKPISNSNESDYSRSQVRVSMDLNVAVAKMIEMMQELYQSNGVAFNVNDAQSGSPLLKRERKHDSVSAGLPIVPSNQNNGKVKVLPSTYDHDHEYINPEVIDRNTVDVIFETMPNIPPEITNALSQLDGDFADYILTNAVNPIDMIREMNDKTLKLAITHVPVFPRLLARADAETIHSTFYKIPRPCDYLLSLEADIIYILKNQYSWLDICFTAVFAKTNPRAIFTDYQLMYINKKIPKFNILMERIPADKWTANNKIAVGAANMLLVMPEYDIRVLNEVLNGVTSGTLNRDLKEMLVKKGAELQGAFILNLLLDGADQPFEYDGIPTEDIKARPSYKSEGTTTPASTTTTSTPAPTTTTSTPAPTTTSTPAPTTTTSTPAPTTTTSTPAAATTASTSEPTTTTSPAEPTTTTSTATTSTTSSDEMSMTIERTKKFMLNPELQSWRYHEIEAAFKKLKYVKEAFIAMTYKEKAQVLPLFDNMDDFLSEMPMDVIKGCVANLPKFENFVVYKDFSYFRFPKTLEKLHFGTVDTIEATKRFMLHDILKNLPKYQFTRGVKRKKYHKEAFASMTNEEMAYIVARIALPDLYLSEFPFEVIKRCVENLPKVKNVKGFDPDKFNYMYFENTFRVYILTKTKEETIENTKELMLSKVFQGMEYEKIVRKRTHWKEAFASMTYPEMAMVLLRVGYRDQFLSEMPVDVIRRCVENVPKVNNYIKTELVFVYNVFPKTMRKLHGKTSS